jgi:hypothetical protein
VRQAVEESIAADDFRAYAPPLGFEELRAAIVEDLGFKGATAVVTDGGIEALYHIFHSKERPGYSFITTDPAGNGRAGNDRPCSPVPLRVAALVGSPDMLSSLSQAAPNNLGSTVLSQSAAIGGAAQQERTVSRSSSNATAESGGD